MEFTGRRMLVIGANGVLGNALAARLVASGARVIGTARTADSADRLAADLAERLLLDLEDDASIEALTTYVTATGIDGIINAAGLVAFGSVLDTPVAVQERLLRVNHAGPAAVMTALLPALQASATAQRQPVMASITGVVAEQAFPGMAAYVASKTAHSAWLKGARLDLRRAGIRVLDARPGHTETGLADRAIFGTAPKFPKGYTAESVADRIMLALANDETELPSAAFNA